MSNPGAYSIFDYFLNPRPVPGSSPPTSIMQAFGVDLPPAPDANSWQGGQPFTGSSPPMTLMQAFGVDLPQASGVNGWQGGPPATALNPNPTAPGAAGLGAAGLGTMPPALPSASPTDLVPPGAFPRMTVQPALPPGGWTRNPQYPSPGDLANSIYKETSGQRQITDGPSLGTVRDAMANARLNAQDQHINTKGYMADPNSIPGKEWGNIANGILPGPDPNRPNPNKPAADAWFSSFDAALSALNRTSAPTTGPGSGAFFNQRGDRSTAANFGTTNERHNPPWPFVGTAGPYYSPDHLPYWAFFGKPGK